MPAGDWRLHAVADDALLGEMTIYEYDFPWLYAKLAAAPAFAPLRPLFVEEARLARSDDFGDAWEAAYARVRAAAYLVDPDGTRVPEFLLHIDGDEAWWRYSDEAFDEE
ncbi:hypothetical protein [Actinoplanes sp. NPDC049118]|uniref:hypothetical protein n=1 Tax=Actinoplanes sp. NPDC049118 TaxID=3155769 RepID=UPI0033CC4871